MKNKPNQYTNEHLDSYFKWLSDNEAIKLWADFANKMDERHEK